MFDFSYTIAGAVTGLVVGLTGVGSGALMTPILLLIFGVAPLTAVGTDLWFAAITKLFATHIHHVEKLIDWEVVKRLWLGCLPASLITLMLVNNSWIAIDTGLIKSMIGIAVLITVVGLLLQPTLLKLGHRLQVFKSEKHLKFQYRLTVLAGFVVGFMVTTTSVGAGALGIAVLTFLYPLRLSPSKVIATDIAYAIPLALFAGFGHLVIGNVDFQMLSYLLTGSIPGVLIGARLSSRLPQSLLRITLALVLIVISLKLIYPFSS